MKTKTNKFLLVICGLLIICIVVGIFLLKTQRQTAILDTASNSEIHNVSDGNIQIALGSTINISQSTMQNLNFKNLNTDRNMKLRIKDNNGNYIYESQEIKTGEIIKADIINDSKLKNGTNKALAEIYIFDKETGALTNQTNAKILLVKE